jgi:hypothetical protein
MDFFEGQEAQPEAVEAQEEVRALLRPRVEGACSLPLAHYLPCSHLPCSLPSLSPSHATHLASLLLNAALCLRSPGVCCCSPASGCAASGSTGRASVCAASGWLPGPQGLCRGGQCPGCLHCALPAAGGGEGRQGARGQGCPQGSWQGSPEEDAGRAQRPRGQQKGCQQGEREGCGEGHAEWPERRVLEPRGVPH